MSLSWLLIIFLPLASTRPVADSGEKTTTYPPGPPEIISYDDYEANFDYLDEDEEDDEMSFMNSERNMSNDSISVEIDTFVRKSNINSSDEVSKEDQIFYDLLDLTDINKTDVVIMKDSEDLGLELTWWHVLILSIACLLFTCLCCYVTSCCYLTLDCCSDQYWGCCSCCIRFVKPTKPPPHVKLVSKTKTHDATVNNSKYSLNENSTAPRTRGSSKSLTNSNRGSSKSINVVSSSTLNVADKPNKERKYTVDRHKAAPEETEQLINPSGDGHVGQVQAENVTTLSSSATLSSVKSVRNYKRTRPASTLQGDSFAKNAGLSESLPHVYQDGTGSYFSWLHLFGKSKRRYNVSRRKKPRGQVQGTNNNIYRQTRYRHIAESRNSAVIPVKIAKRSSTASTYNSRPMVNVRSRSAETISSQDDILQVNPMQTVTSSSEKHLPRSRLSANLAQLQARKHSQAAVNPCPEYNLKYFEKSLMKSKETTL